jgi:hypothetical protein
VRSGRWVAEPVWPSPAIRPLTRYLTAAGLAEAPAKEAALPLASPLDTGTAGGEYCQIWLGAEGPLDQRRDDAGSLTFDSPALTEPLEILGAPVVELEFSSDRPVAQLTARLNEIGPGGASLRVSYGVLNLCHRESHAEPSALEPGKRYRLRLQLDDCAHRFGKGHRLRLALSTAYWPMVWPAPETVRLTVYAGAATLSLPQRLGGPEVSLPPPATASPAERPELRPPRSARHLVQDVGQGEVRMEILDDFGAAQILPHGLEVGMVAREIWTLRPDDPLSAAGATHWTMTMGRGDWRVRTETRASLTGDAHHFHVDGSVEAFEGQAASERLVLRRQFKKSVRRGFI